MGALAAVAVDGSAVLACLHMTQLTQLLACFVPGVFCEASQKRQFASYMGPHAAGCAEQRRNSALPRSARQACWRSRCTATRRRARPLRPSGRPRRVVPLCLHAGPHQSLLSARTACMHISGLQHDQHHTFTPSKPGVTKPAYLAISPPVQSGGLYMSTGGGNARGVGATGAGRCATGAAPP